MINLLQTAFLTSASRMLNLRSRLSRLLQRFAWFVSDVTRKDWEWLLNSMVYGSLFPDGSDAEIASLKQMGLRWKSYEKSGKWVYEQHPL